ncbi:MAG: D-tyrosyl-tRNA(Tyr) deacylase [Burkholderiaceae bacterium]|nr:D-tyrosyl-tRNA(Tyr) deacylase [Burkholderiaceae bacterium]
MIGLLQRVSRAHVVVAGQTVGEIASGLAVLLCAERGDTPREADLLLAKLLSYRVFADEEDRMNRSLRDLGDGGGLLLVPQFTLAADTRTGARPSFTPAAAPQIASELFAHFVAAARREHSPVETGIFGAQMELHLINDGPVTFWLQCAPAAGKETR